MRRALGVVLLAAAVVGVAASSAPSAVRPTVTRAQALWDVTGALHAKPLWLRLVWEDRGTKYASLEWLGFAQQARITPVGGSLGQPFHARHAFVGPATAWVYAGHGFAKNGGGVSSVRTTPLRPVPPSLVTALRRVDHTYVRTATATPSFSRADALLTLRLRGVRVRPQHLWLVRFTASTSSNRLAWMALTPHARIPILGCTKGGCKPSYVAPFVNFISAKTGKGIFAETVSGWKRK